jgi:PhnB protein
VNVNIYLNFNGNCEEAFKFYEKTLGAKIDSLMKHSGSPAEEHVAPEWRDKVLHARLAVGDTIIMASDAPPEYQTEARGFYISLQIDDANEARRIFDAFADGGRVAMPLGKTFWAELFAMVTDRFGTPWMINHGMQ